ncbi:MAG: hypothetical protein OEV28_07105 [Nitrospirota bacterium]|nr:hypothetical protein [Nitrospirota bacterium]
MRIRFALEISDGLGANAELFTELSERLSTYFADKSYGHGLEELLIDIICVAPEFKFCFFEPRKKYTKAKKLFECDVRIDFELFRSAGRQQAISVLCECIEKAAAVLRGLRLPGIDVESFQADLQAFTAEEVRRCR